MRCNLAGMLRQVAEELLEPSEDRQFYAASIEQLREHVSQVYTGTVTLEEFADHYMLRSTVSPKPMSPENAAIYHGDIDGDFNY